MRDENEAARRVDVKFVGAHFILFIVLARTFLTFTHFLLSTSVYNYQRMNILPFMTVNIFYPDNFIMEHV